MDRDLMGKRVKVMQIYQRQRRRKSNGQYEMNLMPVDAVEVFGENPVGWVVGFRSIPDFDFEYGEYRAVCKGGRKVMLVAMTPTNKPFYVPLGEFEEVKN